MSKNKILSIELPAEIADLLKQAISNGEYASNSAIVLEALGKWQEQRAAQRLLRQAILDGIDSGPVANFNMEDLIARAKAARNPA